MMAPLKLIAALVIALSAIVLKVEAGKGFGSIGEEIAESVKVSKEDQADAEKVYSVAKAYVGQLNSLDKPTGEELLKAWNKVLHKPNWFTRKCDKSTLSHIKTISLANPESKPELRTLEEASKKYARDCVTKEYIEDRIRLQRYDYAVSAIYENIFDFIDDRFIADYWLEYPEDKLKGLPMDRDKAAKTIAKTIVRKLGDKAKGIEYVRQAEGHLWRRLYGPCSEYWHSYKELYYQILRASEYLEGGYQKLFTSLNNESQNALSRFQVCMDDYMALLKEHAEPPSKELALETSKLVLSELKSLRAE